jgi:hypothetical protein
VRDALQENRAVLIRKAIRLATGKRPNAAVLCKLMDKLLPSLHSQEIKATPFPVEVVRIIDNVPRPHQIGNRGGKWPDGKGGFVDYGGSQDLSQSARK